MRETFPRKKRGDRLEHQLTNRWSSVCRRFVSAFPGSNLTGLQGGTFSSSSPLPAWCQTIVEITEKLSDYYYCKLRYYNGDAAEWISQDGEWKLDATGLGMDFSVGEIVTAYWHEQRGMFVPIIDTNPLMETEGETSGTLAALSVTDGYYVEYWLERRAGTKGGWTCINQRRWYLNVYWETLEHIKASGMGFVTFRARDGDEIRLVARLGNAAIQIEEVEGYIKLEALKMGGVKTQDEVSGNATPIQYMTVEALVNNVDGEVARPKFDLITSVYNNDAIRITTPGEKEWTVEATYGISVVGEASGSTSSVSTSSESSFSCSSISTSSVSELVSSSSSSSSISTSSESSPSSSISTSCTSTSSGSGGEDCTFCQTDMPAFLDVVISPVAETVPRRCITGECSNPDPIRLIQVPGNPCQYRMDDLPWCWGDSLMLNFTGWLGDVWATARLVRGSDSAEWAKLVPGDEENEINCEGVGVLPLIANTMHLCDFSDSVFEVL